MKEEYEYEVLSICDEWEDTENKLNAYARDGWRVKCSYQRGEWIILERLKEKK
jgi:hypothetical protein